MDTKIFTTAIVGGGASGLMLASMLCQSQKNIALFERADRVGKKLSATGNGQGNITNLACESTEYGSSTAFGAKKASEIVCRYGKNALFAFFESLGVLLCADERGRVYPAGRQASALTDALRFFIAEKGVQTVTGARVVAIKKQKSVFELTMENGERHYARTVALCAGGKASKNFGTDGSAYALATGMGHTLTSLYPSLVQLKTEVKNSKTLKGIRVADAVVTAYWGKETQTLTGDVIFTDYGVSGDAIFRISSYIADKIQQGVRLTIDFLPQFSYEKILALVVKKRERFPNTPYGELLCGIVNNQIGRAVMKLASDGDLRSAVKILKAFPLTVTGTLGFDYAQVTKGGIPLEETDENLQSNLVDGLYFAGEILDVDGRCGGFNLQWAYSSAKTVANAIIEKTRGQVCV
ncbi:MAG: aminoacetone oxidase family FAD-binding enzyme [Clostridiales bacterium]|nr:aminoacetone oxidase family FAD-binding enzyme [Clostridiales bacterium]